MRRLGPNLLAGIVSVALTAASPAVAQSTWSGSVSGSWSIANNWLPASIPASSINTQLTFGATSNAAMTDDIPGTFLLNRLTFNAGDPAYTLAGNPLDFRTNASAVLPSIVMNSANAVTIGNTFSPFVLTNNLTVNGTGTGTLAINGTMSGGGSLTYAGTGTMNLGNAPNTYTGGTFVTSGTLALTSGFAMPAGGGVTVASGAQFNIGSLSNSIGQAIGTLTLNGGTFRVPSGSGNYYLNQLQTSGGTVDFTGTSNFALHITGAGTGITINAGTGTWTGAGTSHIQNDTANPLTINFNGGTLNAGIILANGTSGQGFRLTGAPNTVSTMVLTNPGNTATVTADSTGYLQVADPTFLGSGALTLQNTAGDARPGTLWYTGAGASSSKPITLGVGGGQIYLSNPGTNLTLAGTIGEPPASPGQRLLVSGADNFNYSTLTLTGTNTFTGPVVVNYVGVLSVGAIPNGGIAGPLGASSSAPANLKIGDPDGFGGTLQYTGGTATTDRGITLVAYTNSSFTNTNSVEVTNQATNLTFSGQFTGTGGLSKLGPGTLTLGGSNNNYAGGTFLYSGRLALGSGTAIPIGGNVTVSSGAEFNTAGLSNTAATAIGTLTLSGGTFKVLAGSGDYYLNAVAMTNGAVDFTGSTNAGLHFTGAGAGVTINAGTSAWIGDGTSHIQNDTANPLTITVNGSGILNVGAILSNGPSNAPFVMAGPGGMRLTNTGNTANITAANGYLYSNDLSTDVGAGAFGTLGTGTITLAGGVLTYDGATMSTAKPLTLKSFGVISVATGGVNLTLQAAIGDSPAGAQFEFRGSGFPTNPSTLTPAGSNTYTGPTSVNSQGILAVSTIGNAGAGGMNSPIGASSNATANLQLGYFGRGTLLLIGTDAAYSTDRGLTLAGLYAAAPSYGYGGAIGVANATTTLTWSGQITDYPGYAGSFIKTGAGTLVLTNATNNFTGGTYVESGRLTLGSATAIPAGTNVTVSAGAEFNVGAIIDVNATASALGTVALNGGTLRLSDNAVRLYLNHLAMNAGATVDLTVPGTTLLRLDFVNSGAGITVTGNSTWTGAGSYVLNAVGAELPITIAPFVTLTSGLNLASNNGDPADPFRVTGGGTLYLTNAGYYVAHIRVNQARLRMDDLTNVGPAVLDLTLDAGTLAYGGPTVSSPAAFALTAGGGTVEVVNAATTLTITGAISGTGAPALTKTGPGTLALTNTSNIPLGALTINAGRLDVSDDAQLGFANPTVNPACTLRYTANATTSRTFNLTGGTLEAGAGATVTYSGATINGGFLRGGGTHALTGGTALYGVSTFNSTTITVTGPASFTNFNNSGALTVAAGLANSATVNGFINQGGGVVTIGAASAVNVSDFQSYGLLTLNPATIGSGQITLLANSGSSPMFFNGGSRTFIGTPATATASPPVAGMDLHGQNLVVAGGLFINNGFVADSTATPGSVIVDYGALYKGAGTNFVNVITQNGGKVQAGNSPGSMGFSRFVFGPGGVNNYVFAIDNATGQAGPSPDAQGLVSGWGLVKAVREQYGATTTSGDFVWTATPGNKLILALDTLVNPTMVGTDVGGPMANFDPTQSYAWPAVHWDGTYSGPTNAASLTASTAFDTSGFLNAAAGTFGWSLDVPDHALSLTYTPTAVPEPGTLALAGMAAIGWVTFWRRRWQSNGPSATLSA